MNPWSSFCGAFALVLALAPGARGNDLIDVSQLGARGVAFETVAKGWTSIYSSAGLGDFDGDGYSDLALVSREVDRLATPYVPPVFHVVYGRPDFTGLHKLDGSLEKLLTLRPLGHGPLDVWPLGDIDQDGLADLLITIDNGHAGPGLTRGFALLLYGARGLTGEGFLEEIGEAEVRGGRFVSSDPDIVFTAYAAASPGDLNGDGARDLALSAAKPETGTKLVFLVFETRDLPAEVDVAQVGKSVPGAVIGLSEESAFPAAAGDVNGDGMDDLLIGNTSNVLLIYGRKDFPPVLDLSEAPWADDSALRDLGAVAIRGPVSQTNLAYGKEAQAAGVGDLDQDGFGDFVVGASYFFLTLPGQAPRDSHAYLFYGGSSLPPRLDFDSIPAGVARLILPARNAAVGTAFGGTVAALGDVNGDGRPDFAIGAKHATVHGRADAGEVYVLHGGARSTEDLVLAEGFEGLKVLGEFSRGGLGMLISAAGDFNGDGAADLLAAAPNLSSAAAEFGRAYVIFGTGSSGPPLTVVGLEPAQGPLRGGTAVHLSGSGFAPGLEVAFGGVPARSVTVVSSTRAIAETPPAASPGAAEVSVELAGEVRLLPEPFHYVSVLPEIDLASPGRHALRVEGLSGSQFGHSLALGDVTGDRADDLLIASIISDEWVLSIVRGGRDLPPSLEAFTPSPRVSLVRGPLPGPLPGIIRSVGVSVPGDIDGDGLADIGIGASDGSAYILLSRSDFAEESSVENRLAEGDALRLETPSLVYGRFSFAPLDDRDGDGLGDFVLGLTAGNLSPPVAAGGQLLVLAGRRDWPASLDLSDDRGVLARVTSDDPDFSNEVSVLGDADGDGEPDLLVTAGTLGGSHRAFVLRGGAVPPGPVTLEELLQSGGAIYLHTDAGVFFSWLHAAGPGDVNGDGYADMLLANEMAGNVNQGVTYLIYGGPDLPDQITLHAESDVRILGPAERVQSGRALGPAGDFTGDGYPDFIIGAQNEDPVFPGTLSVVYGGRDLPSTLDLRRPGPHGFTLRGTQAITLLRVSTRRPGDMNGDGAPDFAFSEMGSPSFPVTSPGAVHVVFGLPESYAFARGDATFDGEIDISDPIFILGFLFLGSLGFECEDAADANDDGEIVITDAIYILSSLFAGGPSPPEPFPGEGMDPTADPLGCKGY